MIGPYRAIHGLLLLALVVAISSVSPNSESLRSADAAAPTTDRYGIFMMGGDGDRAWAPMMGLLWVIGPGPERTLPAGVRSLYGLPVDPPLSEPALRSLLAQRPSAYWYIENEPNVTAGSDAGIPASVDLYARGLNYYARVIKGIGAPKGTALDPRATLLGPNILNWNFTCTNCGGYASGEAWTRQMRDRYRVLFGAEPPLDIWTIHSYDLDWVNLPQGNATRQIAQIQGMRSWLDGIAALRNAPIWITEIGYHWGYPGIAQVGDGRLYPVGAYDAEHLDRWMRDVFGWLNANAQGLRLDRWFITLSYTEALEPWMGGPRWPGILLFDGPLAAPTINRFGRLYQQFAGASSPSTKPRGAPSTAQPSATRRPLGCALRPCP